jgi:DNA-binding beta-propeller fold protein YncE
MSKALPLSLALALLLVSSSVTAQLSFKPELMKYTDQQGVSPPPSSGGVKALLDFAEILYGTDVTDDNLLEIDPSNAGTNIIGPLGSPVLAGLAYDASQEILYATDTSTDNLVTVDPTNGNTVVIGNTGINLPHGAAIDPEDGTLYATEGSPGQLYKVSKADGTATPVGNIGFDHIGALDFDPTTGILYGAYAYADESGFLVTINTDTGQGTFVANTHRINGLSFDEDGNLFASENGLTQGIPSSLYSVDKNTGAWELIGVMNADNVLGLVFSSEEVATPVELQTWGILKHRFTGQE